MNSITWFKQNSEIFGVLCDWDLAEDHSNGDRRTVDIGQSRVAAAPDQCEDNAVAMSHPQVKPRRRTGTRPFMAIDLLVSNPPPLHKYRRDLQSFFYIYFCAAVTFDPNREQKVFVIEEWSGHDLEWLGFLKRRFLSDDTKYNKKLQNAHADFKPIADGPLRELYGLLFRVEFLSHKIRMTHIWHIVSNLLQVLMPMGRARAI